MSPDVLGPGHSLGNREVTTAMSGSSSSLMSEPTDASSSPSGMASEA
eukprot:CAMPEP_0180678800 /NCGR_PEP_ID=MMETSP1037_2-20121125/68576_1 /TAXON_ID=632150 /ORGANISM="Azadinium spinosum, Strain 3D9" /LENGTH=46 /DNA_ID= /DNA_START= /DNA_END= /DNA_ORIENTATION=